MPTRDRNLERAKRRKQYREDGAKAVRDAYFAASESVPDKMARLRAERLAREAAGEPKPKAVGPISKAEPIPIKNEEKARR
jgi:hypothetical protein